LQYESRVTVGAIPMSSYLLTPGCEPRGTFAGGFRRRSGLRGRLGLGRGLGAGLRVGRGPPKRLILILLLILFLILIFLLILLFLHPAWAVLDKPKQTGYPRGSKLWLKQPAGGPLSPEKLPWVRLLIFTG
jgi:hypothetical protein